MQLPHLNDQQKQELCEQLQQWGLLTRQGEQWICTVQGHIAGAMLYAWAMLEEAERRASVN